MIWINRVYIEVFRSIPLLVLLLWVYYGLPIVFGLSLGPFMAGIITLALSDSAFEAEIFRAGLQSIDSIYWTTVWKRSRFCFQSEVYTHHSQGGP